MKQGCPKAAFYAARAGMPYMDFFLGLAYTFIVERIEKMAYTVKRFDELTLKELYGILKIRNAIFIVEQNCPYQDIDGKDEDSVHVFLWRDGQVDACLRFFPKDEETVQIGRVVTRVHGQGLGGGLLREGIRQVRQMMPSCKKIYIEAQCQAQGYYEKAGFKVSSDVFLEDGIPHVQMILAL